MCIKRYKATTSNESHSGTVAESEAPPCPRSISKAKRMQNSLTVTHSYGFDLMSSLLHGYFQYMYRNERPVPLISSFSSLEGIKLDGVNNGSVRFAGNSISGSVKQSPVERWCSPVRPQRHCAYENDFTGADEDE